MSVNAVPDPPPDRTSKEPAMKVSASTSAATAIVGLLLAFNVGGLTETQGTALVTALVALAALAPLVSGWFTRGQVYAPATVARMVDEAEAGVRLTDG